MTAIPTRPTLKLLLVADSDSQLLACEALCSAPIALHVHWTINVIPRDGTPQALLERLAQRATLHRQSLARLLRDRRLQGFDAIGVFLTGSKLNDIRLALQRNPQRPLLFCGFNGVVLDHFIEGLSWRLGYDLICLSGPRDQDALKQLVAGTPFAQQRTVLTGLRRNAPSPDLAPLSQRPRRLVFAEQVIMPASTTERARLVRLLSDLARRSPNWEVLIKPRIAPGDATFHDVDTHISTTLKQTLGVPPANLRLDYRPLPVLLKQARLLATLSSTAFFDALDFGCRAIAISDLGLQPAYGGHVYAGSGVWRSLEAMANLDALDAEGPAPDPRWLEWMGYGQRFSPSALLVALNELKQQPPQPLPSSIGYPGNAQSSFNQLRLGAEAAIATGDWSNARELLCQARLMRPLHRGVARRYWAVRQANPLLRQIALLISYRELK
ncbi:DUF6716 putative glycosyltransferase [Synechococcus sp. RS9902]|uniref:DUF6716 putative glycosyltransferase n=1 Tax=Synechococcus sp. RS9902 TaxID=221345 RepID=UPI0016447C43|nr:DUF6716 putative glycosyltransferase [Synechococcus sp. RS9902]QNI96534.1 hypothetical protein SynRS9902_00632 [Synechococcus sp. RS9902]